MLETFANGRVRNWASILDDPTRAQAEVMAALPILGGPVALMPDAHLGSGATVGSVIATESAVIPSAVGVDIGCGMAARRLDLRLDAVPDDARARWVLEAAAAIPAGLGRWHGEASPAAQAWIRANPPPETVERPQRAAAQLGTLGSGNHFVELASDEGGDLWILLHSGSRGGGNQLATLHTRTARTLQEGLGIRLEDPELAWLQQGTPEFDAYIRDLGWAQRYARQNRAMLLDGAHSAIERAVGSRVEVRGDVNCHHNYTELEEHAGTWLWVTRKGAIRAGVDDWGLIPGSMGQRSFVVRGLGNPLSYQSCSHGAGRVLSRRKARATLSAESLAERMTGRAWQASDARALLDEHPEAYKPLDVVMRDQADLVRVEHELEAVANYKGVS
jgi:tRNA-splicing ligase RtcB (3'-phosphate/5'-hydroxy nucleic acid ligase)